MGSVSDIQTQLIKIAAARSTAAVLIAAGQLPPAELPAFYGRQLPSNLRFLADFKRRTDIKSWFPEAESILLCAFQYWDKNCDTGWLNIGRHELDELLASRGSKNRFVPDAGYGRIRIPRYACWLDYHQAIRAALNEILAEVKKLYPQAKGKAFVDTSPVAEKPLAVRGGLGWIGKNSLLIHPERGSYFLLGGIALSLPAAGPAPARFPGCGDCSLCVKACPTGALSERGFNPALCVSYWTTMHKGAIPAEITKLCANLAQGCDICQEACPHNEGITARRLELFRPALNPRPL